MQTALGGGAASALSSLIDVLNYVVGLLSSAPCWWSFLAELAPDPLPMMADASAMFACLMRILFAKMGPPPQKKKKNRRAPQANAQLG